MRRYLKIVVAVAVLAGCSGNNENAHTTATTVVPPPPRQVLKAYTRPRGQSPRKLQLSGTYDRSKPLLVLVQPDKKNFREGEEVAVDFWLENAKLKGDGGEYRVRYIVDDDDMQWIDRWEQVVLTGWLPGKHTIRVELVGPDGWPYRNGDYNIVTREITVIK